MTNPRRSLISGVALLSMVSARIAFADPDLVSSLNADPRLQTEALATVAKDPEALLADLRADDSQFALAVGSYAAEDIFFDVYGGNLRRATDAHFPQARAARTPLIEAFEQTEAFVAHVFGVRAHVRCRIPAQVEWILFSGFGSRAEEDASYSPQDVRDLGRMMARANWRSCFDWTPEACADGETTWRSFRSDLEKALSSLVLAEAEMTAAQRRYVRARLVRFMVRWA